jgi:hypothetical protein
VTGIYVVDVEMRRSSGYVTAPGRTIAEWSVRSRYACGSTPTSVAVSQSV